MKENTTFCEQNYGTRGLAQSKMNTFDCEVLGGGTSTAPVCDGLGDDDDEGERACEVLGGGTSTASMCDGLGDDDGEGERACEVLGGGTSTASRIIFLMSSKQILKTGNGFI